MEKNQSILTKYETELEKVVEQIRFSKTTLAGVVIINEYLNKIKYKSKYTVDDMYEMYEAGWNDSVGL